MKRKFWLAVLVGAVFLPAESAGQQSKPAPRFVPIPFDGNPEAVLEEHLRQARDFEALKQLLLKIDLDAKKFDLDSLRRLRLADPLAGQDESTSLRVYSSGSWMGG